MKKTTRYCVCYEDENGKRRRVYYSKDVMDFFLRKVENEYNAIDFLSVLAEYGIKLNEKEIKNIAGIVDFFGPDISQYTNLIKNLNDKDLIQKFFRIDLADYYFSGYSFEYLPKAVKLFNI